MNIYTGLLFQQGYIQDPELAVSLAGEEAEAKTAEQEGERARTRERKPRASFHSHAVSMVCGTTALSPFR